MVDLCRCGAIRHGEITSWRGKNMVVNFPPCACGRPAKTEDRWLCPECRGYHPPLDSRFRCSDFGEARAWLQWHHQDAVEDETALEWADRLTPPLPLWESHCPSCYRPVNGYHQIARQCRSCDEIDNEDRRRA